MARLQPPGGPALVDKGPPPGGIVPGQQARHRDLGEVGIAVELGAVLENELLGLGEQVHVARAAEGDPVERVAL
jgi:hypothetical protein